MVRDSNDRYSRVRSIATTGRLVRWNKLGNSSKMTYSTGLNNTAIALTKFWYWNNFILVSKPWDQESLASEVPQSRSIAGAEGSDDRVEEAIEFTGVESYGRVERELSLECNGCVSYVFRFVPRVRTTTVTSRWCRWTNYNWRRNSSTTWWRSTVPNTQGSCRTCKSSGRTDSSRCSRPSSNGRATCRTSVNASRRRISESILKCTIISSFGLGSRNHRCRMSD